MNSYCCGANVINGICTECKEHAEEEKINDTLAFLLACKEERDAFCKAVTDQDWSTQLRTAAEDILIMYDQLMERLSSVREGTN